MRPHFGEMGVSLPEGISGREILRYVWLGAVFVPYPEGDAVGYQVSLGCKWEREHGLEWTIKDDEVLYVGPNYLISPWGKKCEKEWNYAL